MIGGEIDGSRFPPTEGNHLGSETVPAWPRRGQRETAFAVRECPSKLATRGIDEDDESSAHGLSATGLDDLSVNDLSERRPLEKHDAEESEEDDRTEAEMRQRKSLRAGLTLMIRGEGVRMRSGCRMQQPGCRIGENDGTPRSLTKRSSYL